ncbi:MAG: translocation/assembly module TamB domain-containing protein, partial [Microcystaceae cyanobacterium]
FELSDFDRGLESPRYHKAADLYTESETVAEAGISQGDLGKQLENFQRVLQEIDNLNQTESDQKALPPLANLTGEITGTLVVKTTPDSQVEANFNLLGNQWRWGDWQIDTLQLQGNWEDDTLTLEPLKIQAEESFLAIKGQFSQQYHKGKVQIHNVPLTPFSSFLDLPQTLPIQGFLNASILLGGSQFNPSAKGTIAINDLMLYQGKLDQIVSQFNYENDILNFWVNNILNHQTDSILINGTIPYQFPFAKRQPNNDQFEISLRIRDQGFALLNIFTQKQLMWQQGKGDVNLAVVGNIDPQTQQIKQLDATGQVIIQDAILQSPLIPEKPLTQVNGLIDLNLDQIEVKQLTGQFGGGNVAIFGSLPLQKTLPNLNPLTLQFHHLAFKLPELYEGGIEGQLEIRGTVLDPQIGGNIQLHDGEIFLSDTLASQEQATPINCLSDQSSSTQAPKILSAKENSQQIANPPNCGFGKFNQLQLSLEENIRILKHPILSFTATGNLTLNGTINNPQPSGQINLTRGQVNLLASQLQLSGNNNTVAFFPQTGLDPYLNLNLATSTTETTQTNVRRDPLSSEIDDPFTANRNSLQTVRIKAKVEGAASQLEEAISLSSEPKRSQQEIITLLGGSLANLENQDNATVGLANLAGSAVLGTVPGELGSALGLSEFRIFPTQIINEESRISPSQIGIAAEAGLDLTDDLSLSILKILNTDQAPQWGIRYRFNDQLLLRGSSNFDDDSRGVIEYERRF